jgi:hypothetical protein
MTVTQDSGAGPSSGPAATANIKFNQKQYNSWKDARNAYRTVSAKRSVGSVWNKVALHGEVKDDDNSPFELRCRTCAQSRQLNNPSKWNKEHNCKGPKNRPDGLAALPGTLLNSKHCTPVDCILPTSRAAIVRPRSAERNVPLTATMG